MLRISQVGGRSGTFSEHSGVDDADKLAAIGYYGNGTDTIALDQNACICDRVLGMNKMLIFEPPYYASNRHRSPLIRFHGLHIIEHEHSEKSPRISESKYASSMHGKDLVDEPLNRKIR